VHWLFLLLALGCLFGAWQLAGWIVPLLLVVALVLFVAWLLGWAASQASRGGGNESRILGPEELRRLREQSEARKAAAASEHGMPH
jgi:hypothetical protein